MTHANDNRTRKPDATAQFRDAAYTYSQLAFDNHEALKYLSNKVAMVVCGRVKSEDAPKFLNRSLRDVVMFGFEYLPDLTHKMEPK
jgi:hypothetical protein